jgi:hypothetical protein
MNILSVKPSLHPFPIHCLQQQQTAALVESIFQTKRNDLSGTEKTRGGTSLKIYWLRNLSLWIQSTIIKTYSDIQILENNT